MFPIYGIYPLLTGLFFFFLYVFLMLFWPTVHQYLLDYFQLENLGVCETSLGIPMWTAFVAGIGASVQIMVDVTNDVKTNGYVEKYRRLWYYVLPLIGSVFGIIAYILLFLGFLSLNGITSQKLETQTFSVILVCFLAGYSTEWFMRQLGKVTH